MSANKLKKFVLLLAIAALALLSFVPVKVDCAPADSVLAPGAAGQEAGKRAGPGKETPPEGWRKLDGILRALLQEERRGEGLSVLRRSLPGTARQPEDTVYAYIHLKEGAGAAVIEPYAWRVDNCSETAGLAAAWLYLDRLEELAAGDEVRALRAVLPPVTLAGSVTSEGDALHRAGAVRDSFGFDGSGIKVGVISGGVDSWTAARDSGDLPASLEILSNEIGGDEGTALLEIIHDLAPGAALCFHDHGANILAFNAAVDALAAAGCQIIVDDVCWKEEPVFEDGPVAAHVAGVVAENDILYLSAAGNCAASHYQGTYYRDTGEPGEWHDFSHGASAAKDLYVRLEPGQTITVVLQWNDPWGGSANDYDLYFEAVETYNEVCSDNIQDGTGIPLEVIIYENDTAFPLNGRIYVEKAAGEARLLEVFIYGASSHPPANIVAAGSIFGHPALPGVLAVGAVNAGQPGQIAPYSARGPAYIAFPDPENRAKPDLCGIDGVSISGAGGLSSPFHGTSAAAAHAAAVAALAWSAAPEKTAAEIRQVLLNTAADKGAGGFDSSFGHGLADACAAVEAVTGDRCFATTPAAPEGPSTGWPGTEYAFTTGGSACLQGHAVQYRFDWGDGTCSGWGAGSAVKTWPAAGTYTVRAQARCSFDQAVLSAWSPAKTVALREASTYLPGDVNGDEAINTGDAILVLKSIAGLTALDENQLAAADVNADGKVNVVDAVLILRYTANLLSRFF